MAEYTGWAGALLVLMGYYLTVFKDWRPESGRFLLLSCSASVLLIVNAALNDAYPFLVINVAMILVALYTVLRKGMPTWR